MPVPVTISGTGACFLDKLTTVTNALGGDQCALGIEPI